MKKVVEEEEKVWFEIWRSSNDIKKVTFYGETEKFLISKSGIKVMKRSEYRSYFETEKEAINYKLNHLRNKVVEVGRHLQALRSEEGQWRSKLKALGDWNEE